LANPSRHDAVDLARQLDARILQPLQPLLGPGGTVLVAPDGPLHLVPFAALRSPDGHWRVERYLFVNIASGRELLRPARPSGNAGPPVVIAAPDYGSARPAVAGQRGGMQFAALPGTAEEALALGKLLPGAQVWTGLKASEAALQGLHGPRILHIATHGFFMPERTVPAGESGTRGAATRGAAALLEPDIVPAPTDLPDPYQRSGLALAGANTAMGSGGDGVLTASEACLLDLRGTKLVVLSACETGIGAVAGAEGVVGLRRALVLAGAESLLMSLWKVDDAATRDLMVAFYVKLQAGAGRAEAIRQAQLAMLSGAERSHPFYWAAFVAIGDWKPL
jgi:CHAT domain-containing protein